MHRNDLAICKLMLNADLFRQNYSQYPLVKTVMPRDNHGIPTEYAEDASNLCSLLSDGFRNAVVERTKDLADRGHPVDETLTLQTGDTLSVNYAEMYAMIQTSRVISDDKLQAEITTGLTRLASEQTNSFIFMSLCKSIYVFWNYPALQQGFSPMDLEAIDMTQRYMNGALWTAEVHGNLANH